jgi:hypothetical protein
MWVDLDMLYGEPDPEVAGVDDPDRPPGHVIKATGRVPGLLKWWVRAVDGRWFGKVNFSVCDSYGAIMVRHDQALVPAAALSPAERPKRR